MKKKIIKILSNKLEKKIINFSQRYTSIGNAKIISKIIVRAEKMEILTHGLHYFLYLFFLWEKKGIDMLNAKNVVQHPLVVGLLRQSALQDGWNRLLINDDILRNPSHGWEALIDGFGKLREKIIRIGGVTSAEREQDKPIIVGDE